LFNALIRSAAETAAAAVVVTAVVCHRFVGLVVRIIRVIVCVVGVIVANGIVIAHIITRIIFSLVFLSPRYLLFAMQYI
jgi:hypothetical protein